MLGDCAIAQQDEMMHLRIVKAFETPGEHNRVVSRPQATEGDLRLRLLRAFAACQSAFKFGSDSYLMMFSAELVILQWGNQRHASQYSNFVACAEWVGY